MITDDKQHDKKNTKFNIYNVQGIYSYRYYKRSSTFERELIL